MCTSTWNLTDLLTESEGRGWSVGGSELGSFVAWHVTSRILQTGRSQGVHVVEIDNGRMKVTVLPTRGMGIWRAELDGKTLGWKSPTRGPVHPNFVPISEPSGIGWLDGFDELVVRCGLESNGAPELDATGQLRYPLHGKIANLPAHSVTLEFDASKNSLSLKGVVDESRFHFSKLRLTSKLTIELESSSFHWEDEVENIGGTATSMQMLYHINIGQPFLGPGAKVVAPIAKMAPRNAESAEHLNGWEELGHPTAGKPETVYFFELLANESAETSVMLKNSTSNEAVRLKYNTSALPCFMVWKNEAAEADGYVTGIEPATNFPNTKSFEASQGRTVPLEPGQRWQGKVALDWFTDVATVANAEEEINRLQQQQEPVVHEQPIAEWSETT